MEEPSRSSRLFLTAKKRVDCLLSWASILRLCKRSIREVLPSVALDLDIFLTRRPSEPSDWSRACLVVSTEGRELRGNGRSFWRTLRYHRKPSRISSASRKRKSTTWKGWLKTRRRYVCPR